MPIIKSAKKRVKVANKAAIRNSKTKRSLKKAIKLFSEKANEKNLKSAQSSIDKASKKGVIHKKKASRIKSRLAKKAKSEGVKITSKKATPKKTTSATKKSPAKKPQKKN